MINNVMKLRDGLLGLQEGGLQFSDKSKRNRVTKITLICITLVYGLINLRRYSIDADIFYLIFGVLLVVATSWSIYTLTKEVRQDTIAFADIAKVSLRQYPNGMVSGKVITKSNKVKRFMLDTGFGNVLGFVALLEGKQIAVKAKLRG